MYDIGWFLSYFQYLSYVNNHAFLSIFVLMMAQSVEGQKESCVYEDYIYLTDRAYIEYQEGDLKASIKHWKEAFQTGLFPRGKHVALALRCAVKVEDGEWAKTLAFRLAKGGIPAVYFDRYKERDWYADFATVVDDTISTGAKNYNFSLRKALLDVRYLDSLTNVTYHQWRKCENDLSLEEMIQMAANVYDGFTHLIRQYGFPSEKKMGYYFQDGEVQDFPLLVMMIHLYQFGNPILKDQLHHMVCDGVITKTEMSVLIDMRGYGNNVGLEEEMRIRWGKRRCR